MNLLIIDDEQLTRDGLLHSIDWKALGISNVYQADDGIHGLALARRYLPEIVLSDVRMPRMDGIEMARQVREILPECSIIFMSGYSDKEYLKAAIKLKAISYVEKPIDLDEIRNAVLEAVQNQTMLLKQKHSKTIHRQDELEKLALKLTYVLPDKAVPACLETFAGLGYRIREATCFTTLILKLYAPAAGLQDIPASAFSHTFHDFLRKMGLHCIHANKKEEYFIFHLFGPEKPGRRGLERLSAFLAKAVAPYCAFDMAFGRTVSHLTQVSLSYNSAVILLQSAFFTGPGQILYQTPTDAGRSAQPPDWTPLLSEYLKDHNREGALSLAREVYTFFREHSYLLPGQAKDVYYRLLDRLQEAAETQRITLNPSPDAAKLNTWDFVDTCGHLCEMHDCFSSLLNTYFEKLSQDRNDSSVVYLIREFISRQYQNECLSVKDISEHVLLSSSYVCTIFKAETGQTLNQYLTEYRVEKAKRLLEDPRYKITDISSRVGYSDGNYFGKIFKKNVGLSPSEYREKHVK